MQTEIAPILHSSKFWISFVIAVVAIWAGLLQSKDKRISVELSSKRNGWLSVVAVAILAATQFWLQCDTLVDEFTARARVEAIDAFDNNLEPSVDEASGAASFGGKVYVVDDEKRQIFQYGSSGEKPKLEGNFLIRDGRVGVARQPPDPTVRRPCAYAEPQGSNECGNGNCAISSEDINGVDDLEGAATYKHPEYGDGLYLVTSNSRDKKQKDARTRQLLLRVGEFQSAKSAAAVAWVDQATLLADRVNNALRTLRMQGAELREAENDCLNIEGFAIDEQGTAYFGLRSPVAEKNGDRYAILLVGEVETLLSHAGSLEPRLLKLQGRGGAVYGITSLEWVDHRLLLLGNHPQKTYSLPPKLWTWQPIADERQFHHPEEVADWSVQLPPVSHAHEFHAKPEAIVLPETSPRAYVFFDALGQGNLRSFDRQQIGIAALTYSTARR